MAPRAADLDRIPFPDFSLLRPDAKGLKHMSSIPVLTSRGCPFDCSFCSVTGMFGRKYRFRSTENIIEELRLYNDRKTLVFFYDDNFAADPKRTRELCEAMIREKFKFTWTTQVRADVARDPELVGLMKKAGCHTVYIGFESVNPDALEDMKKKPDRRRDRPGRQGLPPPSHPHPRHVRPRLRPGRLEVGPQDGPLRQAGPPDLDPVPHPDARCPGSAFYDRIAAENRIRFHDWALYDAHHAVFQPARFSLPDLQKAQSFAHRKFYSLRQEARKILAGQWIAVAIAHYARNLDRTWKRRNRTFLRVIALLKPRPGLPGQGLRRLQGGYPPRIDGSPGFPKPFTSRSVSTRISPLFSNHPRESPMPNVLTVRGLKKSYGAQMALAGIDFEVRAGEVFALIGPNGAGKTTTLRIVATLLTVVRRRDHLPRPRPLQGARFRPGEDQLPARRKPAPTRT